RAPEEEHHRREPHDRTVARRHRIGSTAVWLVRALEPLQSLAHRAADVEAATRAALVPVPIPPHVALELVHRIEAAAFYEALGEAERHRGVVSPRAGREVEGAATDDVGDGPERARLAELEGRPERVAGGES